MREPKIARSGTAFPVAFAAYAVILDDDSLVTQIFELESSVMPHGAPSNVLFPLMTRTGRTLPLAFGANTVTRVPVQVHRDAGGVMELRQ